MLDIIREALESSKRVIESNKNLKQTLSRGFFGDISTLADVKSEEAIVSIVKRRVPSVLIVSEEAGIIGSLEDSEYVAIIDPIDGTVNLTHSIPFYSAAIAIAKGRKFKDILAAGIMNLVNGDIILADSSSVTLNGVPVNASSKKSLSNAMASIDMKIFKEAGRFSEFLKKVISIAKHSRCMGSAALETAYIACGFIDCFIGLKGIKTVDMVASAYIVKRAGGCIKWLDGDIDELDLLDKREIRYIATANEDLMKELIYLMESTL